MCCSLHKGEGVGEEEENSGKKNRGGVEGNAAFEITSAKWLDVPVFLDKDYEL